MLRNGDKNHSLAALCRPGLVYKVGRSETCDLHLEHPDAPQYVSRRHAELLIRDGRLILRNLRPHNGTFVEGRALGPEEELALSEGDSISFGQSGSREYPHIFVLHQLQQLLSASTPSPSPKRHTPTRSTPMPTDLVAQLKTEPSLSTQQTALPAPEVITIQDCPAPSERDASEDDDDDVEIDVGSVSPLQHDSSDSPVAHQATEGAQLGPKETSPPASASPEEAMARAGQLAQQLSSQPARPVAATEPQTPVQPSASSAPLIPGQPAASTRQDRFPAHTSSPTAHRPDLVAASPGVQVPVQAPASSMPHPPGSLPGQRFPADLSPAAAGQRANSSAGQEPVQTGASTPVQRYPAQKGLPAAGQQSRLDDIATTVMATMHPVARPGQAAATSSPERFPSMPNASSPAPKPALPQSPFKTSGSANASSLPVTSAEKTPEGPGQRAAQTSPSAKSVTRQSDDRHAGHGKAEADDADGASKDNALAKKVQPGDQAPGSGQAGEPSQQSQQAKSPFRSMSRSPLHHEQAWEDTDDEDGVSGGDPSEMDWERHITASAIPQPAGARPANGHHSKGTEAGPVNGILMPAAMAGPPAQAGADDAEGDGHGLQTSGSQQHAWPARPGSASQIPQFTPAPPRAPAPAPVPGPSSASTQAPAKPKPAAYEFQDLLKAIVTAARQKLPYMYKDTFKERVSKLDVPDYNVWVRQEEEMWIEEVMCRIGKAAYRTHEPMLADVDQIYTNAAKYNTPGNGEHGGPDIMQHAKTLADSARAEAANHLARLRELEARIVLEPDPPPRPRRVHSAGQGPMKPLPEGFTFRRVFSPAKPQGYSEYIVECPHHGASKRLDRWKAVAEFFVAHAPCKPEWNEWGMLSGELDDDYEKRIRKTFTFIKEHVPERLRVPDHHTDGRSAGTIPIRDSGAAFQRLPEARKTWHAETSDPARQQALQKIVDKLQTIQSRTAQPGSAQGWDMPPAEDIEKELYRRANTLEEYTKYSTFGHRFSKIVDSWHQNQRREQIQPERRSSPSRRGSSSAEHTSPTLAPGIDTLLQAGALLERTEQAAGGEAPLGAVDVSGQHSPAGLSAAAAAPPAQQPAARITPGSSGQQLQLSQGQAELLAQVHMAQNNRAAHAGSTAPAGASAQRLSQALSQHPPGAGAPTHSSAPAVLHRTQATAGVANGPTQQPSQSGSVAPTKPPVTSLQLPVTPTQNRNGPSTPRLSGQRKQPRAQQQPPSQQGTSARPAASAKQSSAAASQRAAANDRIMTEFSRALGLQAPPHGPLQQQAHRPNTLQMGIRPDAAPAASAAFGNFAQLPSPADMQRMVAALQASYAAAQRRPALPAASSGEVRIVVQQRPTLGVGSSAQSISSQALVPVQLPSSMGTGQPLSAGPARFPAPFQLLAQHTGGPRPQQHVPGVVSHSYPSTLPPGVATRGLACPMYTWVPGGATPHSQQQGTPHGQVTAAAAALPAQSQPARPAGAVAQEVASGQARAAGPAAAQHPAPPRVTGQKRAAEPLCVQDTSAPKQPRTYPAQPPLQLLPHPVSGQLTPPAAAQSGPPALAVPASSAHSAESAFVEALGAANLHGPRLVTELRSEREKNSLLATELRSERDRTSQLEAYLGTLHTEFQDITRQKAALQSHNDKLLSANQCSEALRHNLVQQVNVLQAQFNDMAAKQRSGPAGGADERVAAAQAAARADCNAALRLKAELRGLRDEHNHARKMHAEVADENATLRNRVAALDARDTSRTQIEDLYAKLVASGILDPEEEEEEKGVGNGRESNDAETGAEEDSDADMASDPVSEIEEPDEAGGEVGIGSAPLNHVSVEVSAETPAAGNEEAPE